MLSKMVVVTRRAQSSANAQVKVSREFPQIDRPSAKYFVQGELFRASDVM